jgi:signal transduction histidine kinase
MRSTLVVRFFNKIQHLRQRSIFIKLLLIFLATAVALFIVIRGFFFIGVDRNQSFKADLFKNLSKYSIQLVQEVGTPPEEKRARALAKELGIQFRVKGSEGTWSTDPSLPSVSTLRVEEDFSNSTTQVGQYRRHPFVLIQQNGIQYALFFLHRPFGELPAWSFFGLVGVVGLIIGASYLAVHRLFRPLNWLTEGVGEIAQGHFNHQVPIRSTDELGRLTQSFNEMAQQVNEMIRARDRLLLDVSHELRSPLTRMKLALEMVQDEPAKKKLQQEVRELEAMVTELLESERLNSEAGGLTVAPTDLVTIVKELAESYASVGPGVRLVASPQNVHLPLDGHRVQIALRNVIENAVKYSRPEYGPVTLRIEVMSDSALVTVQDHGLGISTDEQSRIFEPFYRLDPSRTRHTGGYGLGLSLVKKIMIAHGGEVLLQSDPDCGSTFTLKFPMPSTDVPIQ